GFKPTYGRVPQWPVSNSDNTSHMGPMARTVADAALMLSVMAGPDDRDRTCLDAAPEDYVGRLGEGIKGLRVAWSPDLGGLRVDPDVATVAKQAALAFKDLDCALEEVADPRVDDTDEMIRVMWNAHYAGNFGQYLRKWRARMDPGLVAAIEDGRRYSAKHYVEVRGKKFAHSDSVRALFDTYDLLLTPSVSVTA